MIVYRIYNRLTGESYIGQTKLTLSQRISCHLHSKKSIVGKAMREQGQENFDISVIDVCENKELADKAEKFWIKFYNAIEKGYNIHEGGTADKKYMAMLSAMPKKPRRKYRQHWRKKMIKERAKAGNE